MQPPPPIERPISFSWDPPAALRERYRVGSGHVLNVFGERRTAGMALLDGAVNSHERQRGGSAAAVARAGGELSGA
jgi:hypothetical protein